MRNLNFLCKVGALLCCIALIGLNETVAQAPEKIKVTPSDGQKNSSFRKLAYYYPNFQNGQVVLLNGLSNAGNLNYNMLSGEVEFIDSKRDTLELANMYTVSMVVIGTDSFYYDQKNKALLKLIDNYTDTKLLVRERYKLSNIRSVGAFGIESNSAAPNTSSEYELNNSQNKLKQNQSLIFTSKSDFFYATHNGFLQANKSNTMTLFSKHKSAIKEYIEKNRVDFDKKEQVLLLLQFANSL